MIEIAESYQLYVNTSKIMLHKECHVKFILFSGSNLAFGKSSQLSTFKDSPCSSVCVLLRAANSYCDVIVFSHKSWQKVSQSQFCRLKYNCDPPREKRA